MPERLHTRRLTLAVQLRRYDGCDSLVGFDRADQRLDHTRIPRDVDGDDQGPVDAGSGLFIGAVILMSVLLLTLVFRSILVPLKAALLNLLSIGAAFGVIVMVFQWGWGAGLIGLESTVPIMPFIPMFMFAILFGLSMDYEVFLLSRVREEYLLTGDRPKCSDSAWQRRSSSTRPSCDWSWSRQR